MIHVKKKKSVVTARYLQSNESIKTFLTLELSHYRKRSSIYSSSEPVAARSADLPRWKRHVFVLARPTRPSCAGARPQELGLLGH